MADETSVDVAVIGGGIAGITTAIKLLRQGYNVTLFEKADTLGGNLSSNSKDNKGGRTDVYPHIFGDWYKEFWYLLEEDLGLKRNDLFAQRHNVRMALLPAGGKTPKGFNDIDFATIATPTSLSNLVANCASRVLSAREMFMFGYTYLDLVSMPSESRRTKVLNDLDVTGHLYSRPYMNDEIAGFHDDILKIIWSMPSDQTSALAYQKLLRHTMTFPNETPFAWLIKGPLGATLMKEISDKLRDAFEKRGLADGVCLKTEVTGLELDANDEFVRLKFRTKGDGQPEERVRTFRYAVIATPAQVAARLALESTGSNLAERHPTLARLREAETGRIPVIYLYFKDKFRAKHQSDLRDLPADLIGFKRRGKLSAEDRRRGRGSNNYDISILNLGSLWEPKHQVAHLKSKEDEPVLVLAASHADAIERPGPSETKGDKGEAQGYAMLRKLGEYFPFIRVGKYWNDDDSDIDWTRTRVITNAEHTLFLNDVGSNEWRPTASLKHYREWTSGEEVKEGETPSAYCRNIFFAGDYCVTDVDMATVEAAVQSGVLAAKALLEEHRKAGHAIPMQPHDIYTSEALLLAKLIATPAAFAAALSATYDDASQDPVRALTLPSSAVVLAAAYWADWLRSAEQFWRYRIPGYRGSDPGRTGARNPDQHDNEIGVAQLALNVAMALAMEGPRVGPQLADAAVEGLYGAWHRTVGRVMFPKLRDTLRDPNNPQRPKKVTEVPATQAEPNTWSGLFKQTFGDLQVTPKTVSGAAFGVAATIAHLLRDPRPEGYGLAEETPSQRWARARQEGDSARRSMAAGYRPYDPPPKDL